MSVYIRGAGRDEILIEDDEDGGVFAKISSERDGYRSITLPADERQAAAEALAGDDYRVVPANVPHGCQWTDDPGEPCPVCGQKLPEWERELLAREAAQPDAAAMQEDLHSILHALNLPTAARASSPHEVVEREVVPEIWRLRGQIGRLRDRNQQPDRPEPVDPSEVRVGDQVEIEADDGSWMVRGVVGRKDDDSADWHLLIKADAYADDYIRPRLDVATVRILHRAEPEVDEAAVDALERAFSRVGIYLSRETKRQLIRDHGVRVEVPDAD